MLKFVFIVCLIILLLWLLLGRVVDGSSSYKYNFTMQNYISTYNQKLLNKVKTRELSSLFPVGSKSLGGI